MCDKILSIPQKGTAVELRALDDGLRTRIKASINEFAGDALRTLCLAYADIDGEIDWTEPPEANLICLGIVGIRVSTNQNFSYVTQPTITYCMHDRTPYDLRSQKL
jgi:magnesium-transporting ATPase (P-type)